jgi:hypothetical protein
MKIFLNNAYLINPKIWGSTTFSVSALTFFII